MIALLGLAVPRHATGQAQAVVELLVLLKISLGNKALDALLQRTHMQPWALTLPGRPTQSMKLAMGPGHLRAFREMLLHRQLIGRSCSCGTPGGCGAGGGS